MSSEKKNLKILIIDDEKDFADEIQEFLKWNGFEETYSANSFDDSLKVLKEQEIDIIMLDYKLPKISGLEILKSLKVEYPKIEFIMMSGHGDMETVIKAMRLGAIDYLKKPFSNEEIMIALSRTEKFVYQEKKLEDSKDKISLISNELEELIERNFIGQSSAINEVHRLAMIAAKHENTNVVITGESGTGKEIVARIIHHASKRNKENFCIVNCAAIPSNLLESEFFGHKKGAFTGAYDNKKGFFEISDKGTLFLDEIGEMPMEMQSKMLRAIEEQQIKRIGDSKIVKFDCRIISATNVNLEDAIEENRFRLDLFHRLQTIKIHIPPLRERVGDIPILVKYFTEKIAGKLNKSIPKISSSTCQALQNYSFPGNVRELKNLIERAIIISEDDTIDNIKSMITQEVSVTSKEESVRTLNLEDLEIEKIKKALLKANGNQTKAAEMLGLSRTALIRRLKKYSIS